MAIKIIKEGKKKEKEIFKKTCEKCGCIFEFEEEDLHIDYRLCLTTYPSQYQRYIICPCCGNRIYHDNVFEINLNDYPKVWYTTTNDFGWPDCATCPNKPDPLHPVVGDSPCTWCKKRQFYCVSDNINISDDTKDVLKKSNLQFKVVANKTK